MNEEVLTRAYHQIITKLEIPLAIKLDDQARGSRQITVEEGKWYIISDPIYSISKDKIIDFLRNNFGNNANEIFQELLKRGFLIPLSGSYYSDDDVLGYRSLHMDVLIRSSEIRTLYGTSKYILSSKLAFNFVETPTQEDRRIQLNRQVVTASSVDPLASATRDLVEAIERFFDGHRDLVSSFTRIACELVPSLDAYQALALCTLMNEEKSVYALVAPTGSGKTEVFLLYALAWLMKQRYIYNDKKSRVLLVYPRKALTVDQANRIIRLLYLSSRNGFPFTFAIRDGDTPKKGKLSKMISAQNFRLSFRGTVCPAPNCGGELVIVPYMGDFRVVCSKCNASYDFVKVTRESAAQADIIAVNPWALEVRIMDGNREDVNVYTIGEIGLMVIDEAHEYKGIKGGLFDALLDVIRHVRSVHLNGADDLRIILSSATIPEPEEFVSKLTSTPKSKLRVISYEDVKKRYGSRAITGRRLVLLGLFNMNPQFSWNTYCQLWLVLTTFLSYCYSLRRKVYRHTPPLQSILFVNNIRELKRVRSGFFNNLSLGEPKDHLKPDLASTDPYCYWHYIPHRFRSTVSQEVGTLEFQEELEKRLVQMLSELDVDERTKSINRLKANEDIVVLSTSSLEVGVDYRGVTFILNSGLENPISLIQRLGRGGRGLETLRTVLGIILARATLSETYLLYDEAYSQALSGLKLGSRYKLYVTKGSPAIDDRKKLIKAAAMLALQGEQTYASETPLKNDKLAIELLKKILEEMRRDKKYG